MAEPRARNAGRAMPDDRSDDPALPLFRPEAVKARQISPLGTLIVARSRFGAIASACGIAFLMAIGAALLFGSYEDKVRLTGIVVADRGVVRLEATRDAIVGQLRVVEGERVREGQILFVLDLAEEAAGGPTAQTLVRSLRDQRARLRLELDGAMQEQAAADALALENIEQRQSQLAALSSEMAILRQRVAAASDVRDRYEALRERNYVTITAVEDAEQRLAEARLRLSSIGRDRSRLEAEIAQFVLQRTQLPRQSRQERNDLLRDISQVDHDIADVEARQGRIIRAPVGGVIASLDVAQGQALAARAPIASILPAGSRMEVDLRAPTAAVGKLAEGQHAWLRFDAFPYQRHGQFRGVVRAIARTAAREGQGEWQYRVRVRLEDPRLPALRPDMTAAASIGVGRRRLREILFPWSVE